MKSFPVLRLANLDFLVRSQQAPNANRLCREAGNDQRTIYRDVEYFRDSLGAPLEYDATQKGYVYQSEYHLPPICLLEACKQAAKFLSLNSCAHLPLSFLEVYQSGDLLQWYDYAPSWLNQTKMSCRETLNHGYYSLAYYG
jgi:hypothetical protein